MTKLKEQRFVGERALFGSKDLEIEDSIFADGESPLKESGNIRVSNSSFQWKYPFWYCKDISVKNSTFLEMARAGLWYVENLSLSDCLYEAPKGFRRVSHMSLSHVDFLHAEETLWDCKDVRMEDVAAKGDYFAMNCTDMKIDGFRLVGNYCFDGCKNVEIRNAKLLSKDAFWNCENVKVCDSYITGEYLAWNSKNVTFENCVIESLQGLCYVENLVMRNCRLLHTTLAFEYSTVDAEITTAIASVKNPKAGRILCRGIDELILEEHVIDAKQTQIIYTE